MLSKSCHPDSQFAQADEISGQIRCHFDWPERFVGPCYWGLMSGWETSSELIGDSGRVIVHFFRACSINSAVVFN